MATQFLAGLIGAGIQASRSPHLHECEARAAGIACSYQLIDLERRGVGVEALPQLLAAVQQQGFAGVNITHPCKQAVLSLLDELSDDAAAIGAVNTVVFSAGKRIGHNTDCFGFAESFRRGLADVTLDKVILFGAGGAGSAVALAALNLGVHRLAVYDEDGARAATLAERLCNRFDAQRAAAVTDLTAAMAEADGLIQATPVGMLGYPGLPLPVELLRPELWAAEQELALDNVDKGRNMCAR
jgi:shikimate dehydrogenase